MCVTNITALIAKSLDMVQPKVKTGKWSQLSPSVNQAHIWEKPLFTREIDPRGVYRSISTTTLNDVIPRVPAFLMVMQSRLSLITRHAFAE